MLRIRPEQMEHFANRARERFHNLMVDYIWETFPDRAPEQNRAALASWVRRALALCEKYGVIMEPAAAQLMLLSLLLGVDADEREEWVRDALSRKVAPAGKVRRLIDACHERSLSIDALLVVDEFRMPVEEA